MSASLFIAMPVFSAVDPGCVRWLMSIGGSFTFRIHAGDCSIPNARNHLVAEALKTDCTDVLFIDADLIGQPHHVDRIMSHQTEDIIAGMYPLKKPGPPQWPIDALRPMTITTNSGLVEVNRLPTGFMRVPRSVFEKLATHCEQYLSHADDQPITDYFNQFICPDRSGNPRLLTDDFAFCERWRRIGGKCFVDTNVVLQHVGPAIFPINHQPKEQQ